MEGNKPTKLTLEQNGLKVTWEGPWDANLDDILTGLIGCLRGVSYGDWVVGRIKEWCEEQEAE